MSACSCSRVFAVFNVVYHSVPLNDFSMFVAHRKSPRLKPSIIPSLPRRKRASYSNSSPETVNSCHFLKNLIQIIWIDGAFQPHPNACSSVNPVYSIHRPLANVRWPSGLAMKAKDGMVSTVSRNFLSFVPAIGELGLICRPSIRRKRPRRGRGTSFVW